MTENSNKIYGLVGRKLGHSHSPFIHKMLGNDAYKLYELEPEELSAFVRRPDIGALNITIPYKIAVMDFLDEISSEAQNAGSVNTIICRRGKLYGFNTDLYGFDYTIRRADISLTNKKLLILGSGGAAQTVIACAAKANAAKIVVVSRSGPDNYDNIGRHRDAQIIINTTPVGMYPDTSEMIIDPGFFPDCKGLVDLIYNPLRTRLLMRAKKLCIPFSGGLPMLVSQAVKAHELFFGVSLPESKTEEILSVLARSVQNIALIGMPGSGKTTVGHILGSLTGREVIDIDELVERTDGRSIPKIFAESGEAAFREMESRAIAEAGMRSETIIVTGGGAVKDIKNLAPLQSNGRIYNLKRPVELLSLENRPLSINADLNALAAERLPLYTAFADVSINNDSTPELAAKNILEDFNEYSGY